MIDFYFEMIQEYEKEEKKISELEEQIMLICQTKDIKSEDMIGEIISEIQEISFKEGIKYTLELMTYLNYIEKEPEENL